MTWEDAVARYSATAPKHGFTWSDIMSSEELKLAVDQLDPPPPPYSTASAAVVAHMDNVFAISHPHVAEAPAPKKQRVDSLTGTSCEFNLTMLA